MFLIFPKHEASLHFTHNQHKAYYETVEEYLGSTDLHPSEWVSEEQRLKSLETQELWELQWYPTTPVGFYTVYGADLDAVLKAALKVEESYCA